MVLGWYVALGYRLLFCWVDFHSHGSKRQPYPAIKTAFQPTVRRRRRRRGGEGKR